MDGFLLSAQCAKYTLPEPGNAIEHCQPRSLIGKPRGQELSHDAVAIAWWLISLCIAVGESAEGLPGSAHPSGPLQTANPGESRTIFAFESQTALHTRHCFASGPREERETTLLVTSGILPYQGRSLSPSGRAAPCIPDAREPCALAPPDHFLRQGVLPLNGLGHGWVPPFCAKYTLPEPGNAIEHSQPDSLTGKPRGQELPYGDVA